MVCGDRCPCIEGSGAAGVAGLILLFHLKSKLDQNLDMLTARREIRQSGRRLGRPAREDHAQDARATS